MPPYVNERPVKTGCWTDREDELLAEWQGKYGNRYVPCPAMLGQQHSSAASMCVSSMTPTPLHDMLQNVENFCNTSQSHLSCFLKVVHGSEKDFRQDWSTMRSALASQGEPST